MFENGNIIYFDPFYFKNGNRAKPKYFVVIKNINNNSILASLPTRRDNIPQEEEVENGCVELPDINFNCFVISKNLEVTNCGKKFDFKTHLYGHQLDIYPIELLEELYPIENTDYYIWGKMKDAIYNDLIDCLRNSKNVKRKYKRILNDIIK